MIWFVVFIFGKNGFVQNAKMPKRSCPSADGATSSPSSEVLSTCFRFFVVDDGCRRRYHRRCGLRDRGHCQHQSLRGGHQEQLHPTNVGVSCHSVDAINNRSADTFTGGPPDDRDIGFDSNYNCSMFALVPYVTFDSAPEVASSCLGPTSSSHKLLQLFDRIP